MAQPLTSKLGACVMVGVLTASSGGAALSQTAKRPTAPAKRQGTKLVSSNWLLACKPIGTDKNLLCQATQTISFQKNRQTLLALVVTPWKQKNATSPFVLRVQLPHGVNIPAGVRIQIDDKPVQSLIVVTSSAAGLFARIGLSRKLASSMERGALLKIGFSSLNGNKLQIPATLKGFSSVFAKLQ